MRKLFTLLATLLLTQLAMANETVMYRCQPLEPTQEFKEVQISYDNYFSYTISLISEDADKSLQYKAQYGDDINFPEYASTDLNTDIRIQFYEMTTHGNVIEALYIKNSEYYEGVSLTCTYLNQ